MYRLSSSSFTTCRAYSRLFIFTFPKIEIHEHFKSFQNLFRKRFVVLRIYITLEFKFHALFDTELFTLLSTFTSNISIGYHSVYLYSNTRPLNILSYGVSLENLSIILLFAVI